MFHCRLNTQIKLQAEKEAETGRDWTPWELGAELSKADYNRMVTKTDLPQHTARIPNKSVSRAIQEAKQAAEAGQDPLTLEYEMEGKEEVILDQPVLCEDRFLQEWQEAVEFAKKDGGIQPEQAEMDCQHTKRLLIQVNIQFTNKSQPQKSSHYTNVC